MCLDAKTRMMKEKEKKLRKNDDLDEKKNLAKSERDRKTAEKHQRIRRRRVMGAREESRRERERERERYG